MATQNTGYSTVLQPPPPPPPPMSNLKQIIFAVKFVALFPAYLLLQVVGILSTTESISDSIASNFNMANPRESQNRHQQSLESSAQRRLKAALAAATSFLATLLVPPIRSSAALGSPLYCWTTLAFVVFCGRYFVDCVVALGSHPNGTMIEPLGSALHSALVMLTWQFLGFSTVDYLFTRYGAWVVVAWMIRCFIISFNSAVLARWRANALFGRYEERILRVGFFLHIMYALIPITANDMSFLAPWRKKESDVEIMHLGSDGNAGEICYQVEDHIQYVSRRKTTKEEVGVVAVNIQCLFLFPQGFDDALVYSIKYMQQISFDDCLQIDKNTIKEKTKLNDEDARVLYGELQALVTPPDQVSFDTFTTWIRASYKDSLDLGQKLRDEDNAIMNLDRLLMALLINNAFLLWLVLTGSTTTKVLSIIPFVYFAKIFIQQVSTPRFKMLLG